MFTKGIAMYKENIVIAIHHHIEDSYSGKWIEYCHRNNIKYKLVNCYSNNIVEELKSCDALMWHWSHIDYKAQMFARGLIYALELNGFLVFPNATGSIYFDDKMAQKYLLESIDAPLVKSYLFYDKKSAKEWIDNTSFPKVFKRSSGAGSHSVKLIKNKKEARSYIRRAFGRGFLAIDRYAVLQNRIWHLKRDKTLKSFFNISRGIYRYVFPHHKNLNLPIEKNYLYAQDFIPNCDYDIRIFVIGDRAVSKRRIVRDGDFRASGSGKQLWDINLIPKECVQIAFDVTDKLGMQSVAFDFVINSKGEAEIIEICYAASVRAFPECTGYWSRDLNWTKSKIVVEDFMMEDVLKEIKKRRDEEL
jgi:glutathione synthase/RimK-type ligase-like ATP-grasp enzyme